MLSVNLRDASLKCRKFRNMGYATGSLKRKNGDIIPISLVIHKFDAYLNKVGFTPLLDINLEGEEMKTKIKHVEKHITQHYTINVDLIEV